MKGETQIFEDKEGILIAYKTNENLIISGIYVNQRNQ